MGRCHEFGSQIREGCGHPMLAGQRSCACAECGVVCEGLFDGCSDVWARGPRPVTLSLGVAAAPRRARALNSGPTLPPPEPQPQYQEAEPPRQSPLANGFSGGTVPPTQATRTMPPPPPLPPPQQVGAGSRTDVLRWFEDAFNELRNELHALVSTVTRQQAMLAELLDTREAELRVVMVAESLPELAGEAAAKALVDQTAGLAEFVEARVEDFRVAAESSDLSAVNMMDGMRELMQRIEATAEIEIRAAHDDGALRLQALKASTSRQLKPVIAAVAELGAHIEAAKESEAARNRALRAAVTRQLQPLAAALAASVERSDGQMAEIRARLDAIAGPAVPVAKPRAAPKPRARRTTTPRTK